MENENKPAVKPLYSLDALRGFDMFWIMGGEGIFVGLAALTGWPLVEWWARIGFAIPVNIAQPEIVTQLINKGSVSRAWLGVSIQPVTDEMAKSFALPKARGALINDVMAGGPAEKGGIHQGDVLLKFDGKEVKDAKQLQMLGVAKTTVGKQVTLEVFRDGKTVNLPVTLASTDSASAQQPRSTAPQRGWLGLTVAGEKLFLSYRYLQCHFNQPSDFSFEFSTLFQSE